MGGTGCGPSPYLIPQLSVQSYSMSNMTPVSGSTRDGGKRARVCSFAFRLPEKQAWVAVERSSTCRDSLEDRETRENVRKKEMR